MVHRMAAKPVRMWKPNIHLIMENGNGVRCSRYRQDFFILRSFLIDTAYFFHLHVTRQDVIKPHNSLEFSWKLPNGAFSFRSKRHDQTLQWPLPAIKLEQPSHMLKQSLGKLEISATHLISKWAPVKTAPFKSMRTDEVVNACIKKLYLIK